MAAKKLMNIHDALEYLKNLDIYLDNDIFDDKDFISNWRMVILPWNNEGDRDTNEDSGDENELLSNNLNRSQLLSGATVDLSTSSGNISPGSGDEEEVAGLSADVPSKRNKEWNAFL